MANVSGSVERIFVNDLLCCVTIRKTGGSTSVVLLWSYITQDDTAANRLLHGTYLSMAREALLHNRTLEVSHPSGSALATAVSLEP